MSKPHANEQPAMTRTNRSSSDISSEVSITQGYWEGEQGLQYGLVCDVDVAFVV